MSKAEKTKDNIEQTETEVIENESTDVEEESAESSLYYFYSQGCGWCKRVDPIVDELIAEGHDILKLDLAEGDNGALQKEVKDEYKVQCGTPFFIDGETGNQVCGYREKDILEKWAKGEKIPEPPKPKGPPPQPPQDFSDEKQVETWREGYDKWKTENDHLPNLPDTDQMLERLKKQRESVQQKKQNVTMNEAKLKTIETKLDKLMAHLGVK